MTPQELKNSILQLAIQGKLVEQCPVEGTAAELYNRLKAEKASGIKKGLWGKSKSLTEIEDGEILFEIPDSWRWIKIGEIASVVTKGTTPRGGNVSYLDEGIGFLRAENVAGLDKIDKTNLKCVDIDTHVGFLKRSIIHANDILITIAGTLGRTALVRETDLPLNANQAVSIVRLVNTQDISLLFFIYALNSTAIQRYLTGQKKITAIPNLTLEIIENCLIPLPPLAEQKRIVAKIEELLPLIDRYEHAWTRLEDFNKRFPVDMQKSILQMAIQGKLVEQRPEEGTGEELLKKYLSEKKVIEKTGILKGRKNKPLQTVDDSAVPYELPDNWIWVRLGNLVEIFGRIGFRGYTKQDIVEKGAGAITISPSNIDSSGKTQFDECTYISWEKYEESPEIKIYDGDIILVKTGSSYGKCGIVRSLPEKATINPQLAVLKYILCDVEYLNIVLKSPMARTQFELFVIGTSIPTFSQEKLSNMLIPLPPLAEQKRIVARLEELLPLCERLK